MLTEDQLEKVTLDLIGELAPQADLENLDPTVQFRDQFDFDSVDFMNFAVALQKELQVEIPERPRGGNPGQPYLSCNGSRPPRAHGRHPLAFPWCRW